MNDKIPHFPFSQDIFVVYKRIVDIVTSSELFLRSIVSVVRLFIHPYLGNTESDTATVTIVGHLKEKKCVSVEVFNCITIYIPCIRFRPVCEQYTFCPAIHCPIGFAAIDKVQFMKPGKMAAFRFTINKMFACRDDIYHFPLSANLGVVCKRRICVFADINRLFCFSAYRDFELNGSVVDFIISSAHLII